MPAKRRVHASSDIYLAVWRFIAAAPVPPTYREITKGCFISVGMVQRVLDALEMDGRIERYSGARGIRLLVKPPGSA